jgi:predicted DNA-binding transcriptional regulator YafY
MSRRLPETQRVARILDIVSRISSQPRFWTRVKLAQEYEVSERQITNDLDVIRHKLRLELNHMRGGGYYFERIPRLPALTYSLSEALAIFLAAQAGRRLVGIPQEDLSAAIGRLTSIMPSELMPLLTSGTLLPPPPVQNKHREQMLTRLYQAIAGLKSVYMEYVPASRPDDTTRRRLDPYAVLPTGNSWHVVGWCHLREDVRIFKVDRIRHLELTDVTFERDPEFDFEDFLTAGWGITRLPEQEPEEIELIFESPAALWVAEESWHPTQRLEWLEDGRLRLCLSIPATEEFARWVLRYGASCYVVRPESIREWIQEQAAGLVSAYSDGSSA